MPDFAALVKNEGPPVVSVHTKSAVRAGNSPRVPRVPGLPGFPPLPRPNPDSGPRSAQGSGFIIDRQGHILTNDHVVRGAENVYVTLKDGREFEVEVIGSDRRSDIALLRVDLDDLQGGDPPPAAGQNRKLRHRRSRAVGRRHRRPLRTSSTPSRRGLSAPSAAISRGTFTFPSFKLPPRSIRATREGR